MVMHSITRFLIGVLIGILISSPAYSQQYSKKLANNQINYSHILLKNIDEVNIFGTPGSILVGEGAKSILKDKDNLTVIAHSYYDGGQVVAMSSDQLFGEKTLNEDAGKQLIINCIALSKYKDPRILVFKNSSLHDFINKEYSCNHCDKIPSNLSEYDVLFSYIPTRGEDYFAEREVRIIGDWVKKGGIFIAATTPWVYLSYGPGKQGHSLKDEFVGNVFFSSLGIEFVSKYAHKPYRPSFTPNSEVFKVKKIEHKAASITALESKAINEKSVKIAADIVKGVNSIPKHGVPSNVVVFGEKAFPVLIDKNKTVLIAHAVHGKGSAIAMGNNSWFSSDMLASLEFQKVIDNCINISDAPDKNILVFHTPDLQNYLQPKYNSNSVEILPDNIDEYDVIFCSIPTRGESYFTKREIKLISDWVEKGGVFVAASSGWVFHSYGPGRNGADINTEFVANKFFTPMGISFGVKYGSGSAYSVQDVSISNENFTNAHFLYLIGEAINKINSEYIYPNFEKAKEDIKRLHLNLNGIDNLNSVFSEDEITSIMQVVKENNYFPSLSKNIEVTNAREVNLIVLADRILRSGYYDKDFECISRDYPGIAINPSSITKEITIDASEKRWHSTGLWLNPFDSLTIELPSDATELGLQIRIGGHKDNHISTGKREQWKRWPLISHFVRINSSKKTITSPYAGLVYIDVPSNKKGIYNITLSGASMAPLYILGETSMQDWNHQLSKSTAPLGEIEGDYCVTTTELSSLQRKGYDPEEIALFWDKMVLVENELASTPMQPYKERLVIDRQPSIGYMHSGYPMISSDNPNMKDYVLGFETRRGKLLEEGSWGHFHELGHNNQNTDWTYDGSVEVTVNLFTLYAMEKMLKIPIRNHEAVKNAESKVVKYKKDGSNFQQWKKDPFLALTMYIELQEAFGWDSFKDVFTEYLALDNKERPKTDTQKRSQWVLRYSKAVGYNLCDFFDSWGFPYDTKIKMELASLPMFNNYTD